MYPLVHRKFVRMLETGSSPGFGSLLFRPFSSTLCSMVKLRNAPRYSSETAPDVRRLPCQASLQSMVLCLCEAPVPLYFQLSKTKNPSAPKRKEVEINRVILFSSHPRLSHSFLASFQAVLLARIHCQLRLPGFLHPVAQ